MLSGTSLKTGAGELARMTISPFIFASVLPIKVRMPLVRLKSPRIAMIGIVSPTTASRVRVGRVIRFCQANRHMKRSLIVRSLPARAGPTRVNVLSWHQARSGDVNASLKIACLARDRGSG